MERVCAVCVTYHPDSSLAERLARIQRQVSHLVIVDNGSSAAALGMLSKIAKGDHVTVIPCNENLGIARAQNVGVEYAIKNEYDFALLLDQDTCVNEDLVSVLTRIHHFHADKDRLAVVGAGYVGSQPAPTRVDESELACEEVDAVIASGSLLPLEAFKHIGPFREEFFIDYVDNEYCARARKKGYLVVRAQRTLMDHVIGDPSPHRFLWMTKYTRNHSADRLYYQARNDTVMLRESGKYRAGSWCLKSFGRAFRRCKRVLLFEHDKAAKVFGVLQGWCDGVRGRLGRRRVTGASRDAMPVKA
jgi:rhamnosyltransferase